MSDIGEFCLSISLTYKSIYPSLQVKDRQISWLFLCWTGHKDDYVFKLADEVRKVLAILGEMKEKKLVGPAHIPAPHKSNIPTLQLHPLPEAIAMDY